MLKDVCKMEAAGFMVGTLPKITELCNGTSLRPYSCK